MTGRSIDNITASEVETCISDITAIYNDILVIIDDVWEVNEVIPILRAFCNCKTIVTTRMHDMNITIATKKTVLIGSMNSREAFELITKEVIDCTQLSQEDDSILSQLAEATHKWPLPLSLLRGQLQFHEKKSIKSKNKKC